MQELHMLTFNNPWSCHLLLGLLLSIGPALVKYQQQRLSTSFLQPSLSCLLKVGVPSPLGRESRPAAPNGRRTRLGKHRSTSTQDQPCCPLSVPRGEKQGFYFIIIKIDSRHRKKHA